MEERFFKFSNLAQFPDVIHGVSSRNYGNMRFGDFPDKVVVENRKNFLKDLGIDISNLVAPKLVHGISIAQVGEKDKGRGSLDISSAISATDGLVTHQKNVFLMVTAADCLPVLVYDPVLQVVGIVHAGWRGIVNQIIAFMIDALKKLGSEPQNLVVGIGPSICQRHFVVRNDVLKKFMAFYPSATFVRNNDGYIDLKKIVSLDLKKAGVLQVNIETANFCTFCDNGTFGSFRKEKDETVFSMAVIGMKE